MWRNNTTVCNERFKMESCTPISISLSHQEAQIIIQKTFLGVPICMWEHAAVRHWAIMNYRWSAVRSDRFMTTFSTFWGIASKNCNSSGLRQWRNYGGGACSPSRGLCPPPPPPGCPHLEFPRPPVAVHVPKHSLQKSAHIIPGPQTSYQPYVFYLT